MPPNVCAELVILNDTPGQELACPFDDVRTINLPFRLNSLGEKRNALVQFSRGDVLLPWDDDDVSLPYRIMQSVHFIEAGGSYFNPQRSWWLDSGVLHSDHCHGYCHNASAFTFQAWERTGGYPHTSGNEDALMDSRLRTAFDVNAPIERREDWQYVYRWGVSPRHISGLADGPPSDPHGPHYRRIGQEPIVKGAFRIEPDWKLDYVQLCREACA